MVLSTPRLSNNFLAAMYIVILIIWIVNISIATTVISQRNASLEGMSSSGEVRVCSSDIPEITGSTTHVLVQDQPFFYDFNATLEGTGAVFFYDNAPPFDITTDTGAVNFTPTNDDVGNYSVSITTSEEFCFLRDSIIASFNISNVNDPPYMISIFMENSSSPGTNATYNLTPGPNPPYLKVISGQIELWEDVSYNMSIIADDPDLYIPFSTELIEYENIPPELLFVLSNDTGRATFMPNQSEADVGTYNFKFYVDDGEEAEETELITFIVNMVNDLPVLENKTMLTLRTADSGVPYYLDINATDEETPDLFYNITFLECNQTFRNVSMQNCSIFGIDSVTGVIDFSPLFEEIGNYTINYTVTDGGGASDWHVGNFTIVEYTNHPPNITEWNPTEYNVTMYEGQTQTFTITVEDPDSGTNVANVMWYFDGNPVTIESVYNYTFSPGYEDSGTYNITVVADDGHHLMPLSDSHQWNLIVLDREPITVSTGGRGRGTFGGVLCTENWRCTAWSECFTDGTQIRTCIDLSECGTTNNIPWQSRHCTYTPSPSCYDGIENCHDGSCEVLTDCGGPCSSCPTCSDNILNCHVNGLCEEGVDCGGPCKPCTDLPNVPVCGNEICEAGELNECPEDCIDFWVDVMIFVLILILLIVTSILLYIYRKETVLLYVYRRVRGENND